MLKLRGSIDDVQRMAIGLRAKRGCSFLQLRIRTILTLEANREPAFLKRLSQIGQNCVLRDCRKRAPLGLPSGVRVVI